MLNFRKLDFEQVGFSSLWCDYAKPSHPIHSFYAFSPDNNEALHSRKKQVDQQYNLPRARLVNALVDYADHINAPEQAKRNARKLEKPDSYAVVTGQQLGFLGGPAFTLYKAITAYLLAKKYEASLGISVVPVFWLADEDHDFEEIRKAHFADFEGHLTSFSVSPEKSGKAVSEVAHKQLELESVLEELSHWLDPKTDASDLIQLLRTTYLNAQTHAQSFGSLIGTWLSDLGFVFAGSQHPCFKEGLKNPLKTALDEHKHIRNTLEEQSSALERAGFKAQVAVAPTTLFYFDSDGKRQRLDPAEKPDLYVAGEDVLTYQDLTEQIQNSPQNFSPNVFLRPIFQDTLLPTLSYVAGPGELAYYAQMKTLYPIFGMQMPIIERRASISILPSHLSRKMRQMGWDFHDFNQTEQQLKRQLVEKKYSAFDQQSFKKLHEQIVATILPFKEQLLEENTQMHAVFERYFKVLDKETQRLSRKHINRTIKLESVDAKRALAVKHFLFPQEQLQERWLSCSSLVAFFGQDIIQLIVDTLSNESSLSAHYLFEIDQPTAKL